MIGSVALMAMIVGLLADAAQGAPRAVAAAANSSGPQPVGLALPILVL